jgi:hypothetical protein
MRLSHGFGWGPRLIWPLLILGTTLAHAQPGEPIGRVAALQGRVVVWHEDSPEAERLQVQSPVYQEDLIQTRQDAKAKLILVDGTELTLGPDGALRLTAYVYTPQQERQQSVLQVFFGVFRIVAETLLPRGTFEVQTGNAVAAIRGTDWLARVEPNATAVVVLEGAVAVSQARPEVGGEVLLEAGMGTDVRDAQAPTPPKKWGEARINALLQATTLP